MQTKQIYSGVAAVLATLASVAPAQDLEKAAKALDLISKTASSICNDVSTTGNSSSVELSGTAKAGVSKLVKQLADLKVDGAAKYQSAQYEGLLQKDIAIALRDSATCKQKIFQELNDKLLPKQGQKVSDSTDSKAMRASYTLRDKQVVRTNDETTLSLMTVAEYATGFGANFYLNGQSTPTRYVGQRLEVKKDRSKECFFEVLAVEGSAKNPASMLAQVDYVCRPPT